MKDKIKFYIKEIFKYFIIIAVTLNIVSYFKSQDIPKKSFEIDKLSLLNGKEFNYDKNKPLVIHFWATWCPICKVENKTINNLAKDHQVLTIAIDSGEDESLTAFMKKNDFSFPVLNDKEKFFSNSYNIQGFPTTLIYDKNQQLVFKEVGYTSSFGLDLRVFWAGL